MTSGPVVAALGGNALLRRGQPADAATQRRNVARAAAALAPIAERGPLVVTHGNGPQVGLLAQQDEAAPLDVLGAETEGMIGYLLAQELRNALPGREIATLLTQVVVDTADPAFGHPTKPIGLNGHRRVVPSPEPQEIVELATIRLLLAAGTIVVCAGGGGIPVARAHDGRLLGVEAVIDKDLASARLAVALDASALLLLTDVTAVQDGWDTLAPRPIHRATPAQLRRRGFAVGSMGPKAEAAGRFAEQTGRAAAIGALEEAALLLDGRHGTTVA